MVLAVLFLGEHFHLYHVLGTAAAAAGIFLASLQSEATQQALPSASQRPRNAPLSGAT
jgi:drug/metabolite transporter (DMT)-like permease